MQVQFYLPTHSPKLLFLITNIPQPIKVITFINYVFKPKNKHKTCTLEQCSKSNNYILNAIHSPPSPYQIYYQKNYTIFFFHINNIKNLSWNIYMKK